MAKNKNAHKKQEQRTQEKQQHNALQQHPMMWILPVALVLFLLLGWMSWGPVSRWVSSVGNKTPTTQTPQVITIQGSGSDGGGSGSSPQTPVVINSSGGSGGAGGSGGSDGGSGGGGGGSGDGTGTLLDLGDLYNDIENGKTLTQVRDLVGEPDQCIETLLSVLGLQKVCTWYNGTTSMIITFIDDQVVSKTSIGL